jgi:hypothetical protein
MLCSPRAYFLNVLRVRFVVNPCAAVPIEKNPYPSIEKTQFKFLE